MNTIRPGSFGMMDGKVGILSPEEQKAQEARNKKFVKASLLYWVCAFLVLIGAFVVLVLALPAEAGSSDSALGMILVPFLWMGIAGTGYTVLYWVMLRKKQKPAGKKDKEPWEQ